MTRMTGGRALVRSLRQEGVRVVFGVPGVQLYDAMDALYQEPAIRFITTRHEQAAAYMAFGFSQAGGGVGTALVVPGPGLLNASAAVGTAYAASAPLLVVSGQVRRDELGNDRGACTRSMTSSTPSGRSRNGPRGSRIPRTCRARSTRRSGS